LGKRPSVRLARRGPSLSRGGATHKLRERSCLRSLTVPESPAHA
jgi:hypothetical protein